jgi:LIVCS family branched-chain amino acid:cation transporter
MVNYFRIAILIGFSLFTMFFGAGNIVFPIKVGAMAGENVLTSILGFLFTGVGFPFLAVFSVILYNGDYKPFFNEIGKIPGLIISCLTVAILGLFLANPRSAILVYETNSFYLPNSLGVKVLFYLVFYGLIIFVTLNKNKIADVLSMVISPIKIFALLLFMVIGLWSIKGFLPATTTPLEAFKEASISGYNTTDLLCGFFFISFAYSYLQQLFKRYHIEKKSIRSLITINACLAGALLMAIIYIGFILAAAGHAEALVNVPEEFIIMALAKHIMGEYASLFIAFVVSCACFATSIALTTVTVDFFKSTLLKRLSYHTVLFLVVSICFMMSLLGFEQVMAITKPILSVIYPSLLVLSLMALIYKLTGFRFIQVPFYATLLFFTYLAFV